MGGNLIKGDFRRKGEFESQLAAFSVHTEERIFFFLGGGMMLCMHGSNYIL